MVRARARTKKKKAVVVREPKQVRVRPPRPKQRQRRANANVGFTLSECARKYLSVLEDPFSGATACVPSLTNFPTMKHSVRSQGTLYTGTAGLGFICATPFQGAFNDGLFIAASGVAFAGISIATGTGQITGVSNSPYTTSMTSSQVQIRVVGCGLRVRNITPLLNRGGNLIGGESLGHQSVAGLNDTTFMLWDTTERLSATSDAWSSVVWHPNDEDEFDFLSAAQCGVAPYINPTLAFVMVSPGQNLATQQLYEWESYLVFEAKGSVVHGLTPSMSDPSGLAAVQNTVMPVRMRKPTQASKAARVVDILSTFSTGVGYAARIGYNAYNAYNSLRPPTVSNAIARRPVDIEMVD